MTRFTFVVAAAIAAVLIATASAQDSYDPDLAMSSLYYCKSAYCSSGLSSWSCDACSYHPNFQIQGVYTNSSFDMQAFSGYDPDADQIVVAFRGSSNIKNWIADLTFSKVPYPNSACSGCEVHEGFLEVWQSVQTQVLPDVQALANAHPNSQILVTGHSLGAAVSVHAALNIMLSTSFSGDLTNYNFGLPRDGNPAFAAWAASILPQGKVFRVTHSRDPVPHVPPMDFGFLHCPTERWYDNDGDTSYATCNDSPTAEDPNCSDSVIPFGIDDHLLYLGICTECSCSSSDLLTSKMLESKLNTTRKVAPKPKKVTRKH